MRISDWSSDVCSSDLPATFDRIGQRGDHRILPDQLGKGLRTIYAAKANPGFGVLAGKIELFEENAPEREVFGDYERLFRFPQAHAGRGTCATDRTRVGVGQWGSVVVAFGGVGS